MFRGFRELWTKEAAAVRPAHVLAAVREFRLKHGTGPLGVSINSCEIVVIKARSRWTRNRPFWYADEWAPILGICPSTILLTKFDDAGARAQLIQRGIRSWLPQVIILGVLAGFFTTGIVFAHNDPLIKRLLIGGPFVTLFVFLGVYAVLSEIHGKRADPPILLRAWERAVELADTISAERLPQPVIPGPLPPPLWPEDHAQQGLRLFAADCAGLARDTLEAAFDRDHFEIFESRALAGSELVIATYPQRATYKRPDGNEWILLPQVRMVAQCVRGRMTVEIRLARPLTGVVHALIFGAAGVFGVWRALHEWRTEGAGLLMVGAIFAVVGFAPALALCWRARRILREIRQLRNAWERACTKRSASADQSVISR